MTEPQGRRRLPGPERRREILAAAKELFVTEGVERTSMRNVAARVGVSSTAIYLYFEDKNDLLKAICEDLFRRLLETMTERANAADSPLGRLRGAMQGYIEFGLRNPAEYRLMFMTSVFDIGKPIAAPTADLAAQPPSARWTRRAEGLLPSECAVDKGMETFGFLAGLVADLVDSGVFRREDPVVIAESIWFGGHGLVSLLITHQHFPWASFEALVGTLERTLVVGFLAQPAAA